MNMLLAIAVGGGAGSLARFWLSSWVQPANAAFPWGIFTVNILGGLLMGMIVELGALKLNLSPELRAFLTTGVLGGFTTFSTFSLESALLLQKGEYGLAAAYMTGSVVLSIAALFTGLWIVRVLYA